MLWGIWRLVNVCCKRAGIDTDRYGCRSRSVVAHPGADLDTCKRSFSEAILVPKAERILRHKREIEPIHAVSIKRGWTGRVFEVLDAEYIHPTVVARTPIVAI